MSLTINQKIIKLLSEELSLSEAEVLPSLEYNTIPEWDSVAHMTIISSLEAEFDFMFEDNEISEMTSVEKIIACVEKHLSTK